MTSTSAFYQNAFIWRFDTNGNLLVANKISNVEFAAYVPNRDINTDWPQLAPKTNVESNTARGSWVQIKGCVDSVTGELRLSAKGRPNMLWCGMQMWMSFTNGEEINRGVCERMYTIVSYV